MVQPGYDLFQKGGLKIQANLRKLYTTTQQNLLIKY